MKLANYGERLNQEISVNIQNSKEVLKAVEIVGVSAKKIAKDGVNLADLPEALELLKHVDDIVVAVKDANMIDDELKELDQAELIELGSACYDMIKNIAKA